jgi:hypothetical protein
MDNYDAMIALLTQKGLKPQILDYDETENILYLDDFAIVIDKYFIGDFINVGGQYTTIHGWVKYSAPMKVTLLTLIPYVEWVLKCKFPKWKTHNKFV